MNFGVYVRAKTRDGQWSTINAMDLDEQSFKLFVLERLANAGMLVAIRGEEEIVKTTPYTKEEIQAREIRRNAGEEP